MALFAVRRRLPTYSTFRQGAYSAPSVVPAPAGGGAWAAVSPGPTYRPPGPAGQPTVAR